MADPRACGPRADRADPALPHWPLTARAVLVLPPDAPGGPPRTAPVAEPVRAAGDLVLLSLRHTHAPLALLRRAPLAVALLVLDGAGDVACAVRGDARIVAERMAGSPDHAAVEIAVTGVEDLGYGQSSADPSYEARAQSLRTRALTQLASLRRRCRAVATRPHP